MVRSALILLIAVLFMTAGCSSAENDPFYKKAAAYEEEAYTQTIAAIDAGTYTAEKAEEIREAAAANNGLGSVAKAKADLKELMDSGIETKMEVARAVIDLGMKYNKDIETYLNKKKQAAPAAAPEAAPEEAPEEAPAAPAATE